MEKRTDLKKIGGIAGIIVAGIVILTNVFFIISDRAEVIAQVRETKKNVLEIQERLQIHEDNDEKIDDIIHNLKRLLTKEGMHWEKFRE